jgi:hypothetical protein
MSRRTHIALAAALSVALTSCGDGMEPVGPPAALEAIAGNGQTGTVGEPLAAPIRVSVVDSDGRGVEGVEVVFALDAGGSLAPAGFALWADMFPAEEAGLVDTTNSDGEAAVIWVLGPEVGSQTLQASVEGIEPIDFAATAEPGPPAALLIIGGDGQLDLPGAALSDQFTLRVVDQFGNALADEALDWEVSAGGGNLAAASSTTDESGEASASLTLGPGIGFNTVAASHDEAGSIEFTALALTMIQTDPAGDTFTIGSSGSAVLPDVLKMGAAWDGDSLLVGLAFADTAVLARAGGPNAVAGAVDFDTDDDPGTGIESAVDRHRPNAGSTGMGVDVIVDLFGNDDGNYVIFNAQPNILGTTTPELRGKLIAFWLPSSIIGSGPLRTAAVVGTAPEPTDIVPNDGSLQVAASGAAPAVAAAIAKRVWIPSNRFWGPLKPATHRR